MLPSAVQDTVSYLSVKYSFEPWIVNLWCEQYGKEKTEGIMKACNETPKLSIRVNRLKTDVDSLKESLSELGFRVEKGKLSENVLFVHGTGLLETEEYRTGMFAVQDESSVVAAETLSPKPEDKVIDMCAAPGGKTLAMAELMNNRGDIKAFDVYEHKLELIHRESERLGITCITTDQGDGTVYNESLECWADKILVDGPCSGLGVIRRKPEIKYKKLTDNGKSLAEKQLAILENACRYLKAGGYMVYSTCTINRIENDDVADEFIRRHSNFEIEYRKQFIPGLDETDGFYICRMKKKE